MANTTTIPANSAYTWSSKLVTFRQETQRVMRNTSPLLPWSYRAAHLSDLCLRLKVSGYDANTRGKIIAEGIRAHEKVENKERSLGIPTNRGKGSVEEQEARRRKKKQQSWFTKRQGPW